MTEGYPVIPEGKNVGESSLDSLRAEELQKYRIILETINNGFFALDEDLKIVYFNGKAEKLLGRKREEVIGRHIFEDAFKEAKGSLFEEKYLQALESKRPLTFETFFGRKPYEDWYEVRVYPLSGGLAVFFSIITNQKEREEELKAANQQLRANEQQLKAANQQLRANEQQLRAANQQLRANEQQLTASNQELGDMNRQLVESEEKYRELFDQSMEGIYIHRTDGEIIKANKMASRQSGYSHDELVGMNVLDLHPESDDTINLPREKILNIWSQWKPSDRFSLEAEHRRKDGTVYPVYISTGPIRYGDSKVIMAIARDVTELKKREEEIRKKQFLLSKSQHIGKIGTWELNFENKNLIWTDENYRIFGVEIGTPLSYEKFLKFIHPADRDFVDREWNKGLETGEYDIDHRIIVDGETKWLREKAEITYDRSGNPKKAIGFSQDITTQKEAQKAVMKEKEQVEFYMDLLGHDLGNIHQGISGSIQLLQPRVLDDPIDRRILDLATESVKNATSLTKEVVLLSKLREKKTEISSLNFGDIIDESIKYVTASFPEKDINIETGDNNYSILAEPIVKEIFVNILHNAIRMQGKKPWISISTEKRKKKLIISISDSGPGISDRMKRELFIRFGTKGKRMRRGLGLSIAKILVERYNGDIMVENRIDGDHTRGARFIIELPSA